MLLSGTADYFPGRYHAYRHTYIHTYLIKYMQYDNEGDKRCFSEQLISYLLHSYSMDAFIESCIVSCLSTFRISQFSRGIASAHSHAPLTFVSLPHLVRMSLREMSLRQSLLMRKERSDGLSNTFVFVHSTSSRQVWRRVVALLALYAMEMIRHGWVHPIIVLCWVYVDAIPLQLFLSSSFHSDVSASTKHEPKSIINGS